MERKEKICCYTALEKEFPAKLRDYDKMPGVLYVKGQLPDVGKKSVAIVGARTCSRYGAYQAYEFAKALAGYGVQISAAWPEGLTAVPTEALWTQAAQPLPFWAVGWISVIPGRIKTCISG